MIKRDIISVPIKIADCQTIYENCYVVYSTDGESFEILSLCSVDGSEDNPPSLNLTEFINKELEEYIYSEVCGEIYQEATRIAKQEDYFNMMIHEE